MDSERGEEEEEEGLMGVAVRMKVFLGVEGDEVLGLSEQEWEEAEGRAREREERGREV